MVSIADTVKDIVQAKLEEAIKDKKAPAIVFGATSSKGELFWAQAGVREVGNPDGGPVTPDSVFWICSQTKMITAIAAHQLIDSGKLSLDTPAENILPELTNPVIVEVFEGTVTSHRPAKNPILVRHLLSHTSGSFYGEDVKLRALMPIGYLPTNEGINKSKGREEATKEWFKVIQGDLPGFPLQFEPGTSWEYGYSNDLLAFIVEKVANESMEAFCKKNIFGPVGMASTSFYLTPDLEQKYVKLAVRTHEGENVPHSDQFQLIELDPKKTQLNLGGVGLFSSPRDYLALLRHLLQVLDGTTQNPILKPESLKLFFEPILTPEASKEMDNFFRLAPPGQQHALGMGVQAADKGPDKRKKGTGYWSGWAGTIHYLDGLGPSTTWILRQVLQYLGVFSLRVRRRCKLSCCWRSLNQLYIKDCCKCVVNGCTRPQYPNDRNPACRSGWTISTAWGGGFLLAILSLVYTAEFQDTIGHGFHLMRWDHGGVLRQGVVVRVKNPSPYIIGPGTYLALHRSGHDRILIQTSYAQRMMYNVHR